VSRSERSRRSATEQTLRVQAIALDDSETISRYDRDIVLFALTWLPFGGVSAEHIWLEFGMTPDRYIDRLTEFLGGPGARRLHDDCARELRRFVSARNVERRLHV
jgi:hypothetical protein